MLVNCTQGPQSLESQLQDNRLRQEQSLSGSDIQQKTHEGETAHDLSLKDSSTSERKLLSRKAQQTLRRIRSIKKFLMDNSL
jgi:hypothetical protein